MSRQPNLIHVAIGLVIDPHQRILIAERPVTKSKAGFWEFPGGKVEEGETVFAALKRELLEEVGIHVHTAEPFLATTHDEILLDAWVVKDFSGVPLGVEGQIIKWIHTTEFGDYVFPEGNKHIIQKLIEV